MLARIRQAGESSSSLVEEMLADAMGDFGASGKFWNQLSDRMDANLFQRMIRTFAQALDRLMAALQDQTDLGSKLYFKDLEKVQAELVRFADRTRLRKTTRRVGSPTPVEQNPEVRSPQSVAESQAPAPEAGDAGVAPGRTEAAPDPRLSRQDRAREFRADGEDPVVQAWMDLTDADDAFLLPTSTAKDFSRVMADVIQERPAEVTEESPDRRGVVRKWRIERPAVLQDDQGAYEVGTETVVRQNRDREVWIDISNNFEGTGGSDIHAAVANYAFNNGLVFIEDPSGLTRASIYRRAENMLSSALKFGTARHLRPGKVMLRERTLPDGSTVKLKWGRDDEQNIRQLIELTTRNVAASVPELAAIRYNFDSGQFVREDGNVVTNEDFDRLAASSDARAAKAGRRTLQRAVLGASLLREMDGRRLVQLRAALRAAGGVRPPSGIAYSRQELRDGREPGRQPDAGPASSVRGGPAAASGQPDLGRERGLGRSDELLARPRWPDPDYSQEGRRGQDLEGLKGRVKHADGREREYHAFKPAQDAARRYAQRAGIDYRPPRRYGLVSPEFSTLVANEYERMPHAPQDPRVKASYQAMIRETIQQYEALLETGLQVEFITGEDPYGNPRNVIHDVVNNNHMWVFPTDSGFGSSGDLDPNDNPLFEMTEFEISGRPARVNDIFRVVHDYYGHIANGVGFRAEGEENAWRSHWAMYSPEARPAMTTETRGQNSWVNWGPKGAQNRNASGLDTFFADQKIGLLPDWVIEEGATDERPNDLSRLEQQPEPGQAPGSSSGAFSRQQVESPEFKRWFGDWEAARVERRLENRVPAKIAVPEAWRGKTA